MLVITKPAGVKQHASKELVTSPLTSGNEPNGVGFASRQSVWYFLLPDASGVVIAKTQQIGKNNSIAGGKKKNFLPVHDLFGSLWNT